jgi:hypothetical protein
MRPQHPAGVGYQIRAIKTPPDQLRVSGEKRENEATTQTTFHRENPTTTPFIIDLISVKRRRRDCPAKKKKKDERAFMEDPSPRPHFAYSDCIASTSLESVFFTFTREIRAEKRKGMENNPERTRRTKVKEPVQGEREKTSESGSKTYCFQHWRLLRYRID